MRIFSLFDCMMVMVMVMVIHTVIQTMVGSYFAHCSPFRSPLSVSSGCRAGSSRAIRAWPDWVSHGPPAPSKRPCHRESQTVETGWPPHFSSLGSILSVSASASFRLYSRWHAGRQTGWHNVI